MIPFSHAVIDSDGEVIRQYRWSAKEAKWHKEQGKNVIKLEVEKQSSISPFQECLNLVGECFI